MRLRARYIAFRLLGALLEHLPERLCVGAPMAVFGLLGHVGPWRRGPLRDNLAHALSGTGGAPVDPAVLDRAVARAMRGYGRYWGEGAKLPSLDRSAVASRLIVSEGLEHLRAAVAAGRGVLLALPHVGSWEWGGVFLAEMRWPMTAVAERLEPPELYDWFVAQREAMGLSIVPLDESAGGAIARVLRDGGVVGLLCDRDLQGNGIEVDFLGDRARIPAGPATLALRTGAALLCVAVYSGPGRDHHAVIGPPLDTTRTGPLRADVARVTQQVADELAWLIRRAPEQWHVLQPVFGDATAVTVP